MPILPNPAEWLHWEGIAALLKAPCGGPRSKSYLKGWSQALSGLLFISSCFKPFPETLNQIQGQEWQFAVICRALLSNSLVTFDDPSNPTFLLLSWILPSLFRSVEINSSYIRCQWACDQVLITEQIQKDQQKQSPVMGLSTCTCTDRSPCKWVCMMPTFSPEGNSSGGRTLAEREFQASASNPLLDWQLLSVV